MLAALVRYDHSLHERTHLTSEDICFYFMEHTEGGYSASPSNNKISNFKKPMSAKGTVQWTYKQKAIKQFINDLKNIDFNENENMTVVPGATSKPRSDQNFDNRLDRVAKKFAENFSEFLTCEKLIDTISVVIPSSYGGDRDVQKLKENTKWEGFVGKETETVIIIDDVITTGAHFRAWKEVILENCPQVKNVIGIFWAIHIWPKVEPLDFDF